LKQTKKLIYRMSYGESVLKYAKISCKYIRVYTHVLKKRAKYRIPINIKVE